MKYALHYGVVPSAPLGGVEVAGHSDPTSEHEFKVNGLTAFVSGSWACWGPADQETDGDNTLHVLVHVDVESENYLPDVAGVIGDALEPMLGSGSRLLDWGVVSDPDDHSEGQVLFTNTGSVLYSPLPPL